MPSFSPGEQTQDQGGRAKIIKGDIQFVSFIKGGGEAWGPVYIFGAYILTL